MKIKRTTRRGLKLQQHNLRRLYADLRRKGYGKQAYYIRTYAAKHAQLLDELRPEINLHAKSKLAL